MFFLIMSLPPRKHQIKIILTVILFTAQIQLAYCFDIEAVKTLLDPRLAEQAVAIEVVSVAGKLSHIEYSGLQPATVSLPSPLPTLSFQTPKFSSYGSLTKTGPHTYRRTGSVPGGLIFDLASPGQVRDLLAYQTLAVTGKTRGEWSVALADTTLATQEDNLLLGKLETGTVTSFPLGPTVVSLDLSRSRYLILRLEGSSGSLDVHSISFHRNESHPKHIMHAAWLWDNRLAANNPEQLLKKLIIHNITRIYLQVDDNLERLFPFMKQAAGQGVAIWALDGSPSGVTDFPPLLRRINDVAAFNRRHPDAAFTGFQLDVEPYLLKDFALRRDYYSAQYLALLEAAAMQCHSGSLLLSAALPFWFNQLPVNGRDLSWEAIRRVDEVAVMGYRTDYRELLEITRHVLAAGEKLGKPVLLGVELTPIPDETRVVLKRTTRNNPRYIALAGAQWERVNSYTVPGSRLSFASQKPALSNMLKQRPPFSSFSGWVFHSTEALETPP